MKDPYAVLGLSPDAKPDDVRAAFRRLAREFHPDRNPDNLEAQERFKEINAAYQTLTDANPRPGHFQTQPPQNGNQNGKKSGPSGRGASLQDLFADLVNAASGGGTVERGDLHQELILSFEESALGCTKKLRYERTLLCTTCEGTRAEPGTELEVCGACRGMGRVTSGEGPFGLRIETECSRCTGVGRLPRRSCKACAGSGLSKAWVERDVVVPAGIEAGATQTLAGAGDYLRPGTSPGDLEISIGVMEHPRFQRDGDDVFSELQVPFFVAACGGELDVETVQGMRKLRVPEGTEMGGELRIRGAGVPHRRAGNGDHVVRVKLRIPERVSARAKELITEFEATVEQNEEAGLFGKLRNLFSD